jgi:hypothetical protein
MDFSAGRESIAMIELPQRNAFILQGFDFPKSTDPPQRAVKNFRFFIQITPNLLSTRYL